MERNRKRRERRKIGASEKKNRRRGLASRVLGIATERALGSSLYGKAGAMVD
jgi:hypothetical protein